MTTKRINTKLAQIENCMNCPNCDTKLTKGFGYAMDYFCTAADNKTIAGYVEWDSEKPKDGVFPKFCPLKKGPTKTVKMKKDQYGFMVRDDGKDEDED